MKNWPILLMFELIYHYFLLAIIPFAEQLLDFALKIASIQQLTHENIFLILKNPLSVVICIGLLTAAAFVVFIELAALILYCDCSMNNEALHLFSFIKKLLVKSVKVISPKNFVLVLWLTILCPLSGAVFSTSFAQSIYLPEFIVDVVTQNRALLMLYLLSIVIINYFLFKWIFTLPDILIHHTLFNQASKNSSGLLKGKLIKTVIVISAFFMILGAICLLLYSLAILVLVLLARVQMSGINAYYLFWRQFSTFNHGIHLLINIFMLTGMVAFIMVLYNQYSQKELPIIERAHRSWFRSALFIPLFLSLLGIYSETVSYQDVSSVLNGNKVQIVAHRAGAAFAPENTLGALKECIDSGVDYAEIDVQQTKDGTLIVMHDNSFQRNIGVSKKVWEMNYDAVKKYTVKDNTAKAQYPNERIPTLEEMIRQADGRIGLMIELKSSGHDKQLVEKTIELIQKYDFSRQCIVASMDYKLLKKVKEVAPSIKTAYIVAIAYGNFENLNAADMVSLEASFATEAMKNRLSLIHKPMYVWTVNAEDSMKRVIGLGPYGIVTDNPYLAQYNIETQGRYSMLGKWTKKLLAPNERGLME